MKILLLLVCGARPSPHGSSRTSGVLSGLAGLSGTADHPVR